MAKLIGIVGDDGRLTEVLTEALKKQGYLIESAKEADAADGIRADMVLLCQTVSAKGIIKYADLVLDTDSRRAVCPAGDIHFTPTEFSLLAFLLRKPEQAVSREQILDAVWRCEMQEETRVIDDTVKRIRRKLAPTHVQIDTIWGYGFRAKMI